MNHHGGNEGFEHVLGMRWERPPRAAREKSAALPDFEPVPPLETSEAVEHWLPRDVRGMASVAPPMPELQVHSFSYADVALRSIPPSGQDLWSVQVRVWLHDADSRPILVALVQGDHVLAQHDGADGELVEFREALGSGWQLEIHVPDHPPLLIQQPRRAG